MRKYYTNVTRSGNRLLVREVRDGKRRKFKTEYKPTLYITAKGTASKTATLQAPDGTPVEPFKPGTMGEAYQFIQKYKDVGNFPVYGNTSYEYTFINEEYPDNVEYNINEMVVCNIDIEVAKTEAGYSEAKDARNEVIAITLKNSQDGIFHVFACKPFDQDVYNQTHAHSVIRYYECEDEMELLSKFLELWERIEPDIVTGWNCVPLTSPIWTSNQIVPIASLQNGSTLFDDVTVRATSPISKKAIWKIECGDGRTIEASKDHVIPVRWKKESTYSKLTATGKDRSMGGDLSLESVRRLCVDNDVYCHVSLGDNKNTSRHHPIFETPISSDLCYVLGCLFTDGSISIKDNVASFYNTQPALISAVNRVFDATKKDSRRRPGDGVTENRGTQRIRSSLTAYNPLTALVPWITDSTGKKRLDVMELSSLSRPQFAAFVSGMIDGDGHCSKTGELSIANKHRSNREAIQQLLNWNGCLVWISSGRVSIPVDEVNETFLALLGLHHPIKDQRLNDTSRFSRKRSSNKILRFALDANHKGYWIKVVSVQSTTKYVPMMDIETSSHYFCLGGAKVHNCRLYDIPYLYNRINRIMSEEDAFRLSPWGQIKETTVNIFGKPEIVYDIAGVSVLDYLLIYRKNVLEPRESYRLDYIAQVELNERKVEYGEYGDLQGLYEQNFTKFIEYNIHDVRLVDRIDAKRKLIELQMIVAYHAKVNYVDVLSQVRTWDTLICNYLLKNGVVVPQKSNVEKDTQFTGAFVMRPIPGMYKWIASFDVTSLYPTIMRTLNMGMETKLDFKSLTPIMRQYQTYINSNLMHTLDDGVDVVNVDAITNGLSDEVIEHFYAQDIAVAANGVMYNRATKSFYSVMIEELFNNRLEYKAKMKAAGKQLRLVEEELKRRGIERTKYQ